MKKILLLTVASLWLGACSIVDDQVVTATSSNTGMIAGVVPFDAQLSKLFASGQNTESNYADVYLYDSLDSTLVLDSIRTDETGVFEFDSIKAGEYFITAITSFGVQMQSGRLTLKVGQSLQIMLRSVNQDTVIDSLPALRNHTVTLTFNRTQLLEMNPVYKEFPNLMPSRLIVKKTFPVVDLFSDTLEFVNDTLRYAMPMLPSLGVEFTNECGAYLFHASDPSTVGNAPDLTIAHDITIPISENVCGLYKPTTAELAGLGLIGTFVMRLDTVVDAYQIYENGVVRNIGVHLDSGNLAIDTLEYPLERPWASRLLFMDSNKNVVIQRLPSDGLPESRNPAQYTILGYLNPRSQGGQDLISLKKEPSIVRSRSYTSWMVPIWDSDADVFMNMDKGDIVFDRDAVDFPADRIVTGDLMDAIGYCLIDSMKNEIGLHLSTVDMHFNFEAQEPYRSKEIEIKHSRLVDVEYLINIPQDSAFLSVTTLTNGQCEGEVEFRYPGIVRIGSNLAKYGTVSRIVRFSLPRINPMEMMP